MMAEQLCAAAPATSVSVCSRVDMCSLLWYSLVDILGHSPQNIATRCMSMYIPKQAKACLPSPSLNQNLLVGSVATNI